MTNLRSLEYRPDIDGLRALAVLSVVFFHLGFKGFEGGFVGVDVFFVISGYLITRIIYKKNLEGDFSFRSFYVRRIRRLAPALIFTIATTIFIGFFILSPAHFEQMNGSSFFALISVSNFFFIGVSDYFGISSQFQPLLHTWSLGVEEQFYIVWPLVLFFCMAVERKKIRFFLGGLIITSAVFSVFLAALFSDSKSSFFFTPFRVYEFFIGISLVFIPRLCAGRWLKEVVFLIGLSLVVAAVVLFDDKMEIPSYLALVPTIGAFLIIYSENPSISGRLLDNRILVWIGLISYSLYLVHWPIFVYVNYLTLGDTVYLKYLTLSLSVLAAVGMYYCIERPFRIKKQHVFYRKIVPIISVSFCLLFGLSLHAYTAGGWAWRFSDEKVEKLHDKMELNTKLSNEYYEKNNILPRNFINNGKKNVLVVGDSHSRDVFNALSLNTRLYNIYHMYLDEKCFPRVGFEASFARRFLGIDSTHVSESCASRKYSVEKSEFVKKTDILIIASELGADQKDNQIDRVPSMVSFYRNEARNSEIILFGLNRLPFDPPTLFILEEGSSGINQKMYNLDRSNHNYVNELLKEEAGKEGIRYFDFYSILCDDDKKECKVLDDDNNILYDDDNHWTFAGEKYFGSKILNSGILSQN